MVAYASRRRKGKRKEKKEKNKGEKGDCDCDCDADADVDNVKNDDDDSDSDSDPLFVPLIISVAARFDHADPQAITSRFGEDVFERVKESSPLSLSWRMGSERRLVEWELTGDDLGDRTATDMAELCARIPDDETRLVFVHGDADATVPPSAAGLFAEAVSESRRRRRGDSSSSLPPPRVVMIEGADHNFTQRAKADELIDVIVSSVQEELERTYAKKKV